MAGGKGASAMLEVLAAKVESMGEMLSEVRQDVKEIRDKVVRVEAEVGGLKEEVASLKARPNRTLNGWAKEAFDVVKMLVIALLTALGVMRYDG